jgi:hypothetical protein
MIYTNMLFALALDKIIFGVSPGWWSLGGSGLILGSAVFVALNKGKGADEVGAVGDMEVGLVERRNGTVEEEMGLISGREMELRGDDDEMRGRSLDDSRIP